MSKIVSSIFGPIFGVNEDKVAIYEIAATDSEDEHQNDNGAPVESVNPLGYNLDYFSAFYMVVQGIIGTGIFLTPGSIITSIGSVGASYLLWVCGFIIAIFEIIIYIEYVTYYKKRSGGDVVYLEQAYPKPDYLVCTTYAAIQVVLSFATSSAIAFGQYILLAADVEVTTWKQRGVATAVLVFVSVLSAVNSKWALRLSNLLGFVKVIFCIFIVVTGWVVLGGGVSGLPNSHSIFKNAWEGTTTDGNAISSAIIKVSFSYGGAQYVFGLVGETHPKKTKRIFCYLIPAILIFIFFLYILMITSFYSGFNSIKELKAAGTSISSKFFLNVFGKRATKALDVMVALSALGHLLAVVVGHSRALRECGRQGVLPWSKLWTSTKPFGTPLLPIFVTFIINIIVALAPPAGDAYNFVVDIGSYSGYFFKLLLAFGLFNVRKQRKELGLGYAGWKAPLPVIIVTILFYFFVIAMAFVPPKGGSTKGSDVSFFYATYALTTIGLLLVCGLYYYVWAFVLPKIGDYKHRTLYYHLENGERGHTVVKVKSDEVEKWDREHDDKGRYIGDQSSGEEIEQLSFVHEPKKD